MEFVPAPSCYQSCSNVHKLADTAVEESRKEATARRNGLIVSPGRISCQGICVTSRGRQCSATMIQSDMLPTGEPPASAEERRIGTRQMNRVIDGFSMDQQ